MEELLKSCIGKKIDVTCNSSAIYRGSVTGVEGGILEIRDDDDKIIFVAVDKITVIYECSDSSTRPGFIV